MQSHVIYSGVLGHVIDQVTWLYNLSLSNTVCFLNRKHYMQIRVVSQKIVVENPDKC